MIQTKLCLVCVLETSNSTGSDWLADDDDSRPQNDDDDDDDECPGFTSLLAISGP